MAKKRRKTIFHPKAKYTYRRALSKRPILFTWVEHYHKSRHDLLSAWLNTLPSQLENGDQGQGQPPELDLKTTTNIG